MAAETEQYQNTGYLVETDWLERHLNDTNLRVYDCNVDVQANPNLQQSKQFPFIYKSARTKFEQGQIPRSGLIDTPGVLSDLSSNNAFVLTLPGYDNVSVYENHCSNGEIIRHYRWKLVWRLRAHE